MSDNVNEEQAQTQTPTPTQTVSKKSASAIKGLKLHKSSARLGLVYSEVLGPPVSKKQKRFK